MDVMYYHPQRHISICGYYQNLLFLYENIFYIQNESLRRVYSKTLKLFSIFGLSILLIHIFQFLYIKYVEKMYLQKINLYQLYIFKLQIFLRSIMHHIAITLDIQIINRMLEKKRKTNLRRNTYVSSAKITDPDTCIA